MGGNPSESGCLVCLLQGNVSVEIMTKNDKGAQKQMDEKVTLNIVFCEVVFIFFLSSINFIVAFVRVIPFKFSE